MSTSEELYNSAVAPVKRSPQDVDLSTMLANLSPEATAKLATILQSTTASADGSPVATSTASSGVDSSLAYLNGVVSKPAPMETAANLKPSVYDDLMKIAPVNSAAINRKNFLEQAGQGGGSIWGWVNAKGEDFHNQLAGINAKADIEGATNDHNSALVDWYSKHTPDMTGITNPVEMNNLLKSIGILGGEKYDPNESKGYFQSPDSVATDKRGAATAIISSDYNNRSLEQQAILAREARASAEKIALMSGRGSGSSRNANGDYVGDHDVNIDRHYMEKLSSLFSGKDTGPDKYRQGYDLIVAAKRDGLYICQLTTIEKLKKKSYRF